MPPCLLLGQMMGMAPQGSAASMQRIQSLQQELQKEYQNLQQQGGGGGGSGGGAGTNMGGPGPMGGPGQPQMMAARMMGPRVGAPGAQQAGLRQARRKREQFVVD